MERHLDLFSKCDEKTWKFLNSRVVCSDLYFQKIILALNREQTGDGEAARVEARLVGDICSS